MSTPSCFRISRNARFPEMTVKTLSSAFSWQRVRRTAARLLAQQISVLAAEHQFAVLVMDGRGHDHNAGRALRDERRDGERRIERVADIDAVQEFRGLLDEADQRIADDVRKRAGDTLY